jgi:GDPmannose 4,6-dehydratase
MQWLMLQQPAAEDFVIATGVQHSVRDFVVAAARELDIEVEWSGQGCEEVGVDRRSGEVIVRIDPRYFRPTEVDSLLGDAKRAREKLGWQPRTSFAELVAEMVSADLESARRDHLGREHGFRVPEFHE